jgi:predicted dehydrogenase
MDSIGVGVVGCGFVGRGAHVPAFSKIEGSELVAVADPDTKRLGKVAKKYAPKATYADYADLVQDPNVQAVVVAAPTPLHAKVSMAAINAGKHVLCEMPLAASLDDADELIDLADKAGVVLMPSLTFRFTPNYVKAKELIDGGAVGTPTSIMYREWISAKDLAAQWPAGSWMWNLDESGGPLFTLSVWSIDLMRWLLGTDVTELSATTKYTTLDKFGGTLGYDASATFRMANGVTGCLQYSGSVNPASSTSRLEVVGDSNCLVDATWNDTVTLFDEDPAKTEWKVGQPGPSMWGHMQQDTHFIQCLQQGKVPSITPQDGRRAMEIALQIGTATA